MFLSHRLCIVVFALLSADGQSLLLGQSRSANLLRDALGQIDARNLDSAEALARAVMNATSSAAPEEQAGALLVHGVVAYYRGSDSGAARAFEEALKLGPTLRADWLFRLDSGLWDIWRGEQGRILCGTRAVGAVVFFGGRDTSAVPGLTGNPRIAQSPRISYPAGLRDRGIVGHVVAAALIDTVGRAIPDSVRIIESPDSAFSREVRRYLERATFTPARSVEHAVRACVIVPVDFRLKSR